MGRDEVGKRTVPTGIKRLAYNISNAFLSTLLFFAIYRLYFQSIDNFWIIWACLCGCGFIGSVIIRGIMRFWDGTRKTIQNIVQNILIGAIYAGFILIGFVSFMFDQYFSGKWDWQTFLIVFAFTKFFVFLLSDFIADSITFQN
ncbi:hypothetical protein [Candidatus Lokiarchaeum ossiferum]|uniref:hypothetical protein n=1 Tax=Candidatus Lokiarchaeum ossiferum TaxID=2951803 RepID=UPI00352CFDB3